MSTPWLDMHRRREEIAVHGTAEWELLHEEKGFEDPGLAADLEISDLDGTETHARFLTADAVHAK